jgi:predicted naringenin-chalcone synthase
MIARRSLSISVAESMPADARKRLGYWFMGCAGMVVGAIVIGVSLENAVPSTMVLAAVAIGCTLARAHQWLTKHTVAQAG